MLKTIRIIILTIVGVLSVYVLITKNFSLQPYTTFFLGTFMLVSGLIEYQKEQRKRNVYIYIVASMFSFFTTVQYFLLN